MPDFLNITPLLVAVQLFFGTLLTIALVFSVFNNFVWQKRVLRGVSEIVLIGIAAIIIAAPNSALEVAQWLAATVGFG